MAVLAFALALGISNSMGATQAKYWMVGYRQQHAAVVLNDGQRLEGRPLTAIGEATLYLFVTNEGGATTVYPIPRERIKSTTELP
jgi:hypothetical protein